MVTACTTAAPDRRAEERQAIQTHAAQEIKRICALPEDQRQVEIDKIRKEAGLTVVCSN
jgi:hypothetical protein